MQRVQSKSGWAYAEGPGADAHGANSEGDDSSHSQYKGRRPAAANDELGSAAAPSSASSDSAADASPARRDSPAPHQQTDGVSNGFDVKAAPTQPRRSVDAYSMGAARSGRLQSQSSLSAALALAAQLSTSPAQKPAPAKPSWKRTDVRLSAATFQWSRPSGALSSATGSTGKRHLTSIAEQAAVCSYL